MQETMTTWTARQSRSVPDLAEAYDELLNFDLKPENDEACYHSELLQISLRDLQSLIKIRDKIRHDVQADLTEDSDRVIEVATKDLNNHYDDLQALVPALSRPSVPPPPPPPSPPLQNPRQTSNRKRLGSAGFISHMYRSTASIQRRSPPESLSARDLLGFEEFRASVDRIAKRHVEVLFHKARLWTILVSTSASLFVKTLFDAATEDLRPWELKTLPSVLSELSKEFAIRVVLDNSTTETNSLVYLVHKYHKMIDLLFRDIERQQDDGLLTEQKAASAFQQDRVLTSTDNSMKRPFIWRRPNEQTRKDPNHTKRYGAGEQNVTEDEEHLNLPPLKDYRKILLQGSPYLWLLSRIRSQTEHEVPGPNVMRDVINRFVLQTVGLPEETSIESLLAVHTITFVADWDPFRFYHEQEYTESIERTLEGVITITGWEDNVQAATCLQYMSQTWPTSGREFLGLLQAMVKDPTTAHAATLSNEAIVQVSYVEGSVRIVTLGSVYCIAEVGEQIAWLGSALRSSPVDHGIASCRPSITELQLDPDHPYIEVDRQFSLTFIFSTEKEVEKTVVAADCWHNLFKNPIVVSGYPIMRRPRPDSGLDIPLGIMATLINSNSSVNFGGRVFIKGFSAMLVATEVVGSVVFWHLLVNENGDYISYTDSRLPPISRQARPVKIDDLETSRHILGWCGDIRNFMGAPDANYNLRPSNLRTPGKDLRLQNFSVTGGKFINVGCSLAIGAKDRPVHIPYPPDDHIETLRRLSRRYFVIYDVDDARAWLVDGTSTLLHILRTKIADLQTDPNLKNLLLFDEKDLQEPPVTHTGNAAAFEFLANPNNLDLPIYSRATTLKKTETKKKMVDSVPGGDPAICRVKDCLSQIYQHLELIMAHQAEAQTQPGISLRPKSVFKETLEGFDFMDVVHHEETRARLTTLKKADGGWVKFTREIGATILFGGGFGELFQPKSGIENGSSCLLHASVPTGENYLAACVTDLLSITKNKGDISPRSRLLIKETIGKTSRPKPLNTIEHYSSSPLPTENGRDRVEDLTSMLSLAFRPKGQNLVFPAENTSGAVLFGYKI